MWLKALVDLILPPPTLCHLCRKKGVQPGLPACFCCLEALNFKFKQLRLPKYKGFALSVYDGEIKHLLNRIKYHNDYESAIIVGEVLGLAAKEETSLQCIDYLVPVPLHYNRLKQRGFNQTEAFVQGMIRVWRRPIFEVIRRKDTRPQSDLTANERIVNMKNAFAIINPQHVKGKKVLIIDDIFTTGATFFTLADLFSNYHAVPQGLFLSQTK